MRPRKRVLSPRYYPRVSARSRVAPTAKAAGTAPPFAGCARRDDPYADVACVSHDERVGGAETREIRLHFLDGVLQQFSITAEIRHFDAVMQVLRERHGTPQQTESAPAGGYPSSAWRNAESRIIAYGGKDLVFVSFELAGYAEAVKRKQGGTRPQECR